jgi:hypothetical protein
MNSSNLSFSEGEQVPDYIDARVAKERFYLTLATLLRLIKTGKFRSVKIIDSEVIPRFETESFLRFLKRNTHEL